MNGLTKPIRGKISLIKNTSIGGWDRAQPGSRTPQTARHTSSRSWSGSRYGAPAASSGDAAAAGVGPPRYVTFWANSHPAKKTSSEDSRGPNCRSWLESSPNGPKPPTVMTAHSKNHPRWKCRAHSRPQSPTVGMGARPGSGGTAPVAPPPADGISERKGADNGCLKPPTHRAESKLRQ